MVERMQLEILGNLKICCWDLKGAIGCFGGSSQCSWLDDGRSILRFPEGGRSKNLRKSTTLQADIVTQRTECHRATHKLYYA